MSTNIAPPGVKHQGRANTEVENAEKAEKQRTLQQNRAMHLFFTMLADELNAAGFDMKKTLRHDIDIPWGPKTIKEFLWRPVQKAYLLKNSTTELTTKDIDAIYDVVNRAIGERTGVHVPFPSHEFPDEQK